MKPPPLLVAAVIEHGFDDGPVEIHLEKDGVKLVLNREDWEEIQATLKGKRTCLQAFEEDGDDYEAKASYVFNYPHRIRDDKKILRLLTK